MGALGQGIQGPRRDDGVDAGHRCAELTVIELPLPFAVTESMKYSAAVMLEPPEAESSAVAVTATPLVEALFTRSGVSSGPEVVGAPRLHR